MKPKARMPPTNPKRPSTTGRLLDLREEIGPEDIVDAADEEQTPCRDEDAPPNGSLDKEPQRHRAPHKRGAPRHERQDKRKEAEQ